MAAFRINRTNDAVFKAIFAKYPKITLALINAFLEHYRPGHHLWT